MTLALVVLGAMVGAPLRFLTDQVVTRALGSRFPFGTLTVNVVGSAALGALVGAGASSPVLAFLGAGLCGGLTTYSTFGYETMRLVEDGAYGYAAVDVAGSLLLGLGAAFAGSAAAQAIVA